MKRKFSWLWPAAAGIAILLSCYVAGWLLMPVRRDFGSTWETFRQEQRDSVDVMVFGSSLAYCDVVPAVFWEETGASLFVMAGAEQTIPLSVYAVKEALRTQTPETIFLEITGMYYQEYQNYTKVNVGYMPWSGNRLAATFRAAEPEERFGLLFPLYTYHSRWQEVRPGEILAHLAPGKDPMAGYTFLKDAEADPERRPRKASWDTPVYQDNLAYLKELAEVCRERGCRLVTYVAPATFQLPEEARQKLRQDTEALEDVLFLDCSGWPEEMGIDDKTDWYDGLHFNVLGAEKFTRRLGQYAREAGLLPERSAGDPEVWRWRMEALEERKREQVGN